MSIGTPRSLKHEVVGERNYRGRNCVQNKRTVDQLQKSAVTEHKQLEFTDNMKRASLSRRNSLKKNHDVGVTSVSVSKNRKDLTPVGLVAQQTLIVFQFSMG